MGGVAQALLARDYKNPPCVVLLDNHPNDSRVNIREDGVVQTLSSRCGTGGGNVPMIIENKSFAYPEMGDGVVGTLDAHYSAFPGSRGGRKNYGNTADSFRK